MASRARLLTVLLALAALLAALLVTPGPAARAAVERERVYGAINCPGMSKCPSMKVLWFDQDWSYLGTRGAHGGGYALRLEPGTYHLQFIDQRPAWNTSKYAPTDIEITVRHRAIGTSVTMRPGASITGVARAGGKVLPGARVVAANRSEQSFPTTADKKGRFAVGGLPAGKYCLFTFDRARKYVDTCTWVGGVDFGQSRNQAVDLRKLAGNLTVFVDTKEGRSAPSSTVTVTSRTTGQWWSSKVRSGKAVFRGLFPGRYRIKYEGAGVWFTATGAVRGGVVRSGRMAFGDFTVPRRGGWVTGVVADGGGSNGPTEFTMAGVRVGLYDARGRELATAVTDADGRFELEGQLATQDGLTITVDPGSGGGWMKAAPPDNWCLFEGGEAHDASVTTGEESFYGPVYLPRSTSAAQTTPCRS
ncbi:MSCRAMM family protein [Nocardioides pyridinolyticus]